MGNLTSILTTGFNSIAEQLKPLGEIQKAVKEIQETLSRSQDTPRNFSREQGVNISKTNSGDLELRSKPENSPPRYNHEYPPRSNTLRIKLEDNSESWKQNNDNDETSEPKTESDIISSTTGVDFRKDGIIFSLYEGTSSDNPSFKKLDFNLPISKKVPATKNIGHAMVHFYLKEHGTLIEPNEFIEILRYLHKCMDYDPSLQQGQRNIRQDWDFLERLPMAYKNHLLTLGKVEEAKEANRLIGLWNQDQASNTW